MNEEIIPILFVVTLILLAPLAFHQIMREQRPHSRWFKQNRKPKVEAELPEPYDVHVGRDYEPPLVPAGQCSSCGKFRKATDLTEVEVVAHYQDKSEWVPVCQICRPDVFPVEPQHTAEA